MLCLVDVDVSMASASTSSFSWYVRRSCFVNLTTDRITKIQLFNGSIIAHRSLLCVCVCTLRVPYERRKKWFVLFYMHFAHRKQAQLTPPRPVAVRADRRWDSRVPRNRRPVCRTMIFQCRSVRVVQYRARHAAPPKGTRPAHCLRSR